MKYLEFNIPDCIIDLLEYGQANETLSDLELLEARDANAADWLLDAGLLMRLDDVKRSSIKQHENQVLNYSVAIMSTL